MGLPWCKNLTRFSLCVCCCLKCFVPLILHHSWVSQVLTPRWSLFYWDNVIAYSYWLLTFCVFTSVLMLYSLGQLDHAKLLHFEKRISIMLLIRFLAWKWFLLTPSHLQIFKSCNERLQFIIRYLYTVQITVSFFLRLLFFGSLLKKWKHESEVPWLVQVILLWKKWC